MQPRNPEEDYVPSPYETTSGVKLFRKKPVLISAIEWNGENTKEVLEWAEGSYQPNTPYTVIYIPTLEGVMMAQVGDFIIRGIQGEFYPCKPDIFYSTYEEVTVHENLMGQEDEWHH